MAHICFFLLDPSYQQTSRVLQLGSGNDMTFHQFRKRVECLATALDNVLQLEVGSRVCLLGESTPEFMEVFFACAWNGWVVALLNDRWSQQELTFAINLISPSFIFTDRRLDSFPCINFGKTKSAGDGVLWTEEIIGETVEEKVLRKREDDLAVVCFTSGTTAKPKGVMLSHSTLNFQSFYKIKICGYDIEDVYIHLAPLYHVGGLVSALAMFQTSAQHIFVKKFSSSVVRKQIQTHGVTAMIAVPTMISDLESGVFPSLKKLLIGGGRLNPIQQVLFTSASLRTMFPAAKIWTAYGMTECCSSIVYNGPFLARHLQSEPISTGYSIPGTQVALHPTTGEVLTRGPHVMMGYWADPCATETAFCGDWFRTGDVGRVDKTGGLWLQGRIKDMIKSGGENIHALEIEEILVQHPAINQVVVTGIPHERLGETVGVHFVLHKEYNWFENSTNNRTENSTKNRTENYTKNSTVNSTKNSTEEGGKKVCAEELVEFCVKKGLSRFKLPRQFFPQRNPFEFSTVGKIQKGKLKEQEMKLKCKL